MEEVAERTARKVLMEVDNHSLLIFGDPQGILGQQLRPRLLNIVIIIIIIIVIIILIKYFKIHIIKLF